ncbi:hypothetical protein IHQ11_23685 [Priestia megaterium]|nr:hypothetical protein [Priestia megaterium]
MQALVKTPEPPYYAVIFNSQRTPEDNDYTKTADKMVELASRQQGFIGRAKRLHKKPILS